MLSTYLLMTFAIFEPTTPDNPAGYVQSLVAATQGAQWRILAGLVLLGVVWAIRRYGVKVWAPLEKGKIAFIAAIALGAVGTVATAYAGGQTPNISELIQLGINGASVGLTASGIYAGAKKLTEKPKTDEPVNNT